MDVNFDALSSLPGNYNYLDGSGTNITILAILSVVVLLYFVLFASLGSSEQTAAPRSGSSVGLEVLLWSVFIMLIVFNALQYFFSINVKASLKNLFSKEPELDLVIDQPYAIPAAGGEDDDLEPSETVPEITIAPQAFHVKNNKFTYDDAQAVCKAYGGRLATYDEVEDAYKRGGEWCGYGWSEGQMALYPTQKQTWNRLQGIKGHEHDCGRPGVNGGYIANPNVRFGINCFGYKPEITPEEQQDMRTANYFPKSQKDIEMEKRVQRWKHKISSLQVSPFNHTDWSEM
jgi:heme/copper-type cytochrome/quinol oxidase subunit 2